MVRKRERGRSEAGPSDQTESLWIQALTMSGYEGRARPAHITPELPSMQELEPSPVEETFGDEPDFDAEKHNPYFPSSSSPRDQSPYTNDATTSSSTSTLGLSSSSITRTLQAAQKYSTYPFLAYTAMHITNTSLIPLATRNLHTSDTYLLLFREYYQSPILEKAIVFAPIAVHVFSGIALRIYRRRIIARRHGAETFKDRMRIPWPKLSLQSALGYILYPLIVGHIFVNRLLPLKEEGGSSGVGLRYVAHGFARHPLIANLGYSVFVGIASWHIVGGTAKFLRLSQEYVSLGGDYGNRVRRRRGWIINGISAAVTLVWLVGALGVVGRGGAGSGWEAKGWDKLYSRVPVVGKWLA